MEDKSAGIINKFAQIKMLILFVMSRLSHPVTMEQLSELALCDERICYFDITDSIQKLIKSKHLKLKDDKYSMTPKGVRNSEILEDELPYSVRIKAEEAAVRLNEILQFESLIKTHINTDEAGKHYVRVSLSDGVGEILSIKLLAPNEQQAAELEKGLRKKAQTIYHDIIKLILNPNP